MKNILFIMAYSLESNNGHLTKKFDSQINAAEKLGLNVWYTAFSKGRIYLCNKERKIYLGKSSNISQNILQCHFIFTKMRKIFKIVPFNICYIRSTTAIPSYISALNTIRMNQCKIVIEIPTYPNTTEMENSTRKVFYLIVKIFNRLFGKNVSKYVDLYTLIGDRADSYEGVKAINIQNGVNIDTLPLKLPSNHSSNELHLLAVAMMSYWHGYDRILRGLHDYYNNHENRTVSVYLHLVGKSSDGTLNKLEFMAKEYQIEKYVFFEGFKSGEELNKIFNECDIALGAFGLYRQNLEYASSIKVAEYCARGIPFVYGGKNDLLNNELKFCMQFPNDDSVIEIDSIIKLRDSLEHFMEIQKEMRIYAYENMTWEKQLEKIITILEE